MSPSSVDPVVVSVNVAMGAPSFIPGSLVEATITLRADRPDATGSAKNISKTIPPRSPQDYRSNLTATHGQSPAASSVSLSDFGKDPYARANYVVCEFSGRWSSDRSWVLPYAHASPRADTLDNHSLEPIAEHPHVFSGPDPNSPLPWAAALADVNSVGGGGRPGHTGIIFRSQALVVCEREQIPVGSQVSFAVSCVLPDMLPPTLRGIAIRYTYALAVVVDFPGCTTPKTVRVPFRVVSAGGTAHDVELSERVIPVPTPLLAGPLPNRFLEEKEATALSMSASLLKSAPPDDIEIALALSLNGRLTPYKPDTDHRTLENDLHDGALSFIRDVKFISTPKNNKVPEPDGKESIEKAAIGRSNAPARKKNTIPVYGITLAGDPIARMYLSRLVHHLGDSISAIFHFNGNRPCYRVGARLEAQEVIKQDHAVGQKQGTGHDPSQTGVVFRTVYGEHGEFVMSSKNTHVTFSIPHDAPASFSTSVVTVRWLIHFVFLIPQVKKDTGSTQAFLEDDDFDEYKPIMNQLQISENGTPCMDSDGWEGGTWSGEDPSNWTHLPQKEVDVLRWTLPIVVSGQPESHWGTRSVGKLVYGAT